MLVLVLLLGLAVCGDGLRVLMVTTNVGYSHLGFTGSLADALVDAGHEVDYVIPMWSHDVRSNGTKKGNVIRFYGKNFDKIEGMLKKMVFFGDAFDQDSGAKAMAEMNALQKLHCESMLSDFDFMETLRSRNYSMGFGEFFEGCSFGIFRILGIPVTHEMSACPLVDNDYSTHRLPFDYNHIPVFSNYEQSTPVDTMMDRVYNIYEYLYQHLTIIPNYWKVIDSVFADFGYDVGSVQRLQDDAAFVWVNTFEVVDFARPTSPKFKNIGGIAVKSPTPLDEELNAIMDSASEGIVLISFGSIVDTTHLKASRRDILLSAFASFPHLTFVWKVSRLDSELMAAAGRIAPNVRLVEWMPQSSLLSHPKTVAFITHMGLNSLNEAAVAGVPMVGVPFFGDQQLNSAMAVRRGIARFVDRRSLSVESLREALAAVLTDPKYREASNDVKQKIKAAPFSPKDVFVKTVEFAAKFDSLDEFRLPYDPFYRRMHLDIAGTALVLSVFAFFLIRWLFGFAAPLLLNVLRSFPIAEETKKIR